MGGIESGQRLFAILFHASEITPDFPHFSGHFCYTQVGSQRAIARLDPFAARIPSDSALPFTLTPATLSGDRSANPS